MYLYIPEKDQFDDLPAILLDSMGEMSLVIELELTPERKLARADVNEVMQSLQEKGFYLQTPPSNPIIDDKCN